MSSSELEIFVGEWAVEARFTGGPPGGPPDGPPPAGGAGPVVRTVFEWILGGRYLAQRTEISTPAGPEQPGCRRCRAGTG